MRTTRRWHPWARGGRAPRSGARGHTRRLALESLEDRYLLSYTITDLGTLGGRSSSATGLNDAGQVVGWAYTADRDVHAFLYQDGGMTDLDPVQGMNSWAQGINDARQVVGSDARGAFLYSGGTLTELGTLGGYSSVAYAINNTGQIVGSSDTAAGDFHAFLYQDGVMTDPGTPAGTNSHAFAINDAGQAAGEFFSPGRSFDAYFYSNGQVTVLGTFGGPSSGAWGLNNAGDVVGEADTSFGIDHAFLYHDGGLNDLGTLGGARSTAYAINDAGQVVGFAYNDVSLRAFVYQDGTMTDLNSLIPPDSGWTLYEATGINASGQIVGEGQNPAGDFHAFLLTPTGDAAMHPPVEALRAADPLASRPMMPAAPDAGTLQESQPTRDRPASANQSLTEETHAHMAVPSERSLILPGAEAAPSDQDPLAGMCF